MWCLISLFAILCQQLDSCKEHSYYQVSAPTTQSFGMSAFDTIEYTSIRWLGGAGFLINSRGTTVMIDPVLKGFDLPLLIDMPIAPEEVTKLDAVLVTHCDNDHFSVKTCTELSSVCREYHSTKYVAGLMKEVGLKSFGHSIHEKFKIKTLDITTLYADHAWQNFYGEHSREFKDDDFCGFWIETPDGIIWAPGDTRYYDGLLNMPTQPNVIFFDFSDDPWHIGLDNAIKIANKYPDAELLLSHWGTVDAPQMKAFNSNPKVLEGKIRNPGRIRILAAGEEFKLNIN